MSNRKSTGGVARRVVQKPHIPYRGDDLGVGKKTGVAVERVDRKSDGFEPFQEVVDRMDRRTPPRTKMNGRARRRSPSPVQRSAEDDGEQEVSMDLVDTPPGAAYSLFTNERRALAPASVNRDASSRRLSFGSKVDFDKVPTPRTGNLSRRQSLANRSVMLSAVLDQSFASPEQPINGGDDGGFDDYGQPEDDLVQGSSPRKTSFTELDQDDGDDEPLAEPADPSSPIRSKKDKGKGKSRGHTPDPNERRDDEGVEDEIAQGLGDVDLDALAEDQEEAPVTKKPRKEKPRGRPPKRQISFEDRSPTPEGVRRSRRHRYPPLEFWRQERVVYGRPDTDVKILVPHIKEIVRIPKDPVEPLGIAGKYKRKRSGTAPLPRRNQSPEAGEPPAPYNPEEGWDKDTPQTGIVLDFFTREEVERRIAFTQAMVVPKPAANNDWFFQKVFGDGDFIAAGQLIIPPGGKKPSKGTKDNTYVFYVIEGAISIKIHNTNLVLATGGMFLVPRGNNYFIENIADRNAKLFFTQARKIAMSEEEQASATNLQLTPRPRSSGSERPTSKPPTAGRSSSAGAQVKVNGRSSSRGAETSDRAQ